MYNTAAFLYENIAAVENPEQVGDDLNRLLSDQGLTPPGTLADLGSGTGLMSILLAERGWHMIGVELSEAMLAVAREKTDKLPLEIQSRLIWAQGDISAFALPEGLKLAGALCMHNTINHLAEWPQVEGFIHSVFDILKPNGILILDSDNLLAFHGFFNHAPTVVWEDATHRLTRACQFNHLTGRADHMTTLEKADEVGWHTLSEEAMALQYHLETDLYGAFLAAGFKVESARPYNPCPNLYQGIYPKTLWVLRKPA